jgi:chromosome segregation ATPase
LKPLYEKGYVSESRLKNAEDELELAEFEYEAARREMEYVLEHQARLREAVASASQRLPGMGGSGLANVLAEKTLECESELAAVQVRSRLLQHQMREIEREIAEKRSVDPEVEQRQAEIDARKRRVDDLLERESAVRLEMATEKGAEVVVVEAVERIPELLPSYLVIGEVKKPGTYELLAQRTVLTAIGAAGGFTEYTNEKGIAVVSNPGRRPKSHSLDLNVLLKGESSDEFTIQDGDIIWVPRKTVLR